MNTKNSGGITGLAGWASALVLASVLLVGPAGAETGAPAVSAPRPAQWAVPVTDRIGLPNLFKVSDVLYRGAQPGRKGFAELKAMGIKTVVDLRILHSERDKCKKYGLNCVRLPEITWAESDQDVIDFLRVVTDPANQPVFFHCHHGADRTGVMLAAYRVVMQGWPKEEAIREMTEGGYGFHPMWKNLIKLIQDLNVESIRQSIKTKS